MVALALMLLTVIATASASEMQQINQALEVINE
jgi:hypothetical protein